MSGIDREKLGEWLSAYLDGELEARQCAEIERILQQDAQARRMLNELRRAAELVSALPRHPAPTAIREEVLRHAERLELLGIESPAEPRASRRRAPRLAVLSMAAAVGFVTIGVWYYGDFSGGPASSIFRSVDGSLPGPGAATEKGLANAAGSRREGATEEDAGGVDGPDRVAALLTSATFEQKLQAGLKAEALADHPFDNEAIRLQVSVTTDHEADAAVGKVVAYLSSRQAMDLSQTDGSNANGPLGSSAAFLEGRAGVNFNAGNQRQVLVRAPKGEVAELLDRLADETASSNEVVLAAGPVSIRGVGNVQAALAGPVGAYTGAVVDANRLDKADRLETKEHGEAEVAAQTEHPTTQLVDSLMRALRLQSPGQSAEPTAADEPTSDAPMETSPTNATKDRRMGLDDRVSEGYAAAKGVRTAALDSSSSAVKEATADGDNSTPAPVTTPNDATGKAKKPSLVERRVAALEKQSASPSGGGPKGVSKAPVPTSTAKTKNSPPGGFRPHDEIAPEPADDQVTLVIQVIPEPKDAIRQAPTDASVPPRSKTPKRPERNRNAE